VVVLRFIIDGETNQAAFHDEVTSMQRFGLRSSKADSYSQDICSRRIGSALPLSFEASL
jgi:hypothetical protein